MTKTIEVTVRTVENASSYYSWTKVLYETKDQNPLDILGEIEYIINRGIDILNRTGEHVYGVKIERKCNDV